MNEFQHLVKAIFVIIILYALALYMRKRKMLKEEHSMVLAKIVTELCLPCVIFVSLAGQVIQLDQLAPAVVMLGVELSFIALAWFISARLGFSRAQQGAITFCAAFGSSTFLGYPLIIGMFPHKAEALTEAVIISELGVGYPIFILGPILAAYFGSREQGFKSTWSASLKFFKSPVFFAFIIGFLWGILRLPGEDNKILAPIFQVCHVLAAALTPMAILSVALMFKVPKIRQFLPALGIVIILKLLLKPVVAGYCGSLLDFPKLWEDVLILLAAMPPAVLGVIFIRRYGGDDSLASTLLLAATIVSCVTILGAFLLMG